MSILVKVETGSSWKSVGIRVTREHFDNDTPIVEGYGDTFPEAVKDLFDKLSELHDNVVAELGKLGVRLTESDAEPEEMPS